MSNLINSNIGLKLKTRSHLTKKRSLKIINSLIAMKKFCAVYIDPTQKCIKIVSITNSDVMFSVQICSKEDCLISVEIIIEKDTREHIYQIALTDKEQDLIYKMLSKIELRNFTVSKFCELFLGLNESIKDTVSALSISLIQDKDKIEDFKHKYYDYVYVRALLCIDHYLQDGIFNLAYFIDANFEKDKISFLLLCDIMHFAILDPLYDCGLIVD